ncbi:MAG: hypothetical protein KDM63_07340 [Verrucomicrobiae bacterium]|nr:hypothetical protein [Verrucomicrobiae bacterium]
MPASDASAPSPTAPSFDLEAVNRRHIRSIDKFFRIYCGAASRLLSYEGGLLELEILLDDRLRDPSPEVLSRRIAPTWRRAPELRDATGYVCHCFRIDRPLGAAVLRRGTSPPFRPHRSEDGPADDADSPLSPQSLRRFPLGTVRGTFDG